MCARSVCAHAQSGCEGDAVGAHEGKRAGVYAWREMLARMSAGVRIHVRRAPCTREGVYMIM